ncbi:MAG TPA: TonB family protein [Vicinamibacterales bacterium]|nr:TonB family protein [Vicinamibacterales bacterium]
MHLDIDGRRTEDELIESAIPWHDGLLLALVVHAALIALVLLAPRFLPAPVPVTHPLTLTNQPPMQFVFTQPKLDLTTTKPKPNAPPSDKDRLAQTMERHANPLTLQPLTHGNTPDKVLAEREARARGRGPTPEPRRATQPPQPTAPPRQAQLAENQPQKNPLQVPQTLLGQQPPPSDPTPARAPAAVGPALTPGGSLGDALHNLQRYVQQEHFDNPGGGGQFGPAIQFDTKGVDFGPWIRRFIAQIRRNWFIPQAAMTMKGHVVLTFNVHKNGAITDLKVVGPSGIQAFNNSAFNALLTSNPTQPLPAAYPSEHAFFTVTFYYNETPPQ